VFTGADSTDEFGQCAISIAKVLAIAVLEEYSLPDR
jgi:hypothetical protein